MRVTIFGGSFDPVHKGHLKIIDELSKISDKVIVIPNYLNPLKDSFSAPANLRLKWLKKTITNPKVEISNYEIVQNKPCYTIDTVSYFKQIYDKISFVIGADNLPNLHKWKNIEKLKKLVDFIVISRGDIDTKPYKTIHLDMDISSTSIREQNFDFIPESIKNEVIQYYKKDKNDK